MGTESGEKQTLTPGSLQGKPTRGRHILATIGFGNQRGITPGTLNISVLNSGRVGKVKGNGVSALSTINSPTEIQHTKSSLKKPLGEEDLLTNSSMSGGAETLGRLPQEQRSWQGPSPSPAP